MLNLTKINILVNFLKKSTDRKLVPACFTYRSLSAKADDGRSGAPKKTKFAASVDKKRFTIPPEIRHVYPEFLPDPNIDWRNSVREKLERIDLISRRGHVDIPEFYVGSIMAVTTSDPHSIGKTTRFVGICINRDRSGLRSRFILRNVIDHQGIEVQYEMYDPTIQKVQVLRLEKRLDENLYYLRDSLPEYSTFDVNMEAEVLRDGEAVPVNPLQVQLKPRPWLERWERQNLKGVSNIEEVCSKHRMMKAQLKMHTRPWEKYDLMKQYRKTIPEEEQQAVYSEVYGQLDKLHLQRKIQQRRRAFVKPAKSA